MSTSIQNDNVVGGKYEVLTDQVHETFQMLLRMLYRCDLRTKGGQVYNATSYTKDEQMEQSNILHSVITNQANADLQTIKSHQAVHCDHPNLIESTTLPTRTVIPQVRNTEPNLSSRRMHCTYGFPFLNQCRRATHTMGRTKAKIQ